MKRKLCSVLIASVLAVSMLAGCSNVSDSIELPDSAEGKPLESTSDNTSVSTDEGSEKNSEPYFSILVGWTYLEADPTDNDLYVDVSDGSSSIDISSIRNETDEDSITTYYALVNGSEEKIYTLLSSDTGYCVEIFRDDLTFNISWGTLTNSVETDCVANITDSNGNMEMRKRDDYLTRSYTGAWYFPICSITNGELGDYIFE